MSLTSPYTTKAHQYKGQLHCHSNESDGALTPLVLATAYKTAGFDFLSITDHDLVTADPGVEGLLYIPGTESDPVPGRHITGLNLTAAREEATEQEVIDAILADGGIPVIAHPMSWTASVIAGLTGFNTIEVYSQASGANANAEVRWDYLLSRWIRCYGLAVDDFHNYTEQTLGAAWVIVNADSLTLNEITNNLSAGNFYASTGPTLDVSVAGSTITATTDSASQIVFIGYNGAELQSTDFVSTADYVVTSGQQYVRVKVTRDSDSTDAWSNPIWVTEVNTVADRYFCMGQVFIADGTTTVDKAGRYTTDQTINISGGAGNFVITMANGTSATVTSGTAAITGSPVTLSAGANTLTADGNGSCTLDITIGDAANYPDVNSWSATSGGAVGATVPVFSSDVALDANSFTKLNQAVIISGSSNCKAMDWTGAQFSPVLTHTSFLNVYGAYTCIAAMSHSGISACTFMNNNQNVSLTFPVTLSCNVQFGSNSAANLPTFTLATNLTLGSGRTLYFSSGTFNTGGYDITAPFARISNYTHTKVLNLGDSVLTFSTWQSEGTNHTINAGTSRFVITGATFAGQGETYYIAESTGAALTITGNNAIKELGLMRADAQTITATGTTQTVFNMRRDSGIAVKTLVNGTYVNVSGRPIVMPYTSISGATFTPANMWYFPNSTDGGGNTGGIFNKRPPNGAGWFILKH